MLVCVMLRWCLWFSHIIFFFSSRSRHTRCALVTGVQTCALPISRPDGHAPTFPGLENVLEPGDPLWEAADKGFFHRLRPVPERRLGADPPADHHGLDRKSVV